MIDFYETRLLRNIRKIAFHPAVFPYMFSRLPAINDTPLYTILDPKITVYALRIDLKLAGIGFFVLDQEIATVDVCFIPEFSGKDKKNLAMRVIDDYVDKKKPTAIIGKIKKTNKRSFIFAKWCLFHVEHEDEEFYYVRRNYGQ